MQLSLLQRRLDCVIHQVAPLDGRTYSNYALISQSEVCKWFLLSTQ
jgi:hypothetical protein